MIWHFKSNNELTIVAKLSLGFALGITPKPGIFMVFQICKISCYYKYYEIKKPTVTVEV
jgi:hypothetical protein